LGPEKHHQPERDRERNHQHQAQPAAKLHFLQPDQRRCGFFGALA